MKETNHQVRFSTRSLWLLAILPDLALCESLGAPLFPHPVFQVGRRPASVALGDFDGGGHSDLAVANERSGDVSVLLGHGDGTFASQAHFAAGDRPTSVAVGDFDGDGHADLAVAHFFSEDVSVLLGHGDGTFAPQARFAAGIGPRSVAVGDFDGDGHADLVVAILGSNDVSVLLNQSPVAVSVAIDIKPASEPNSINLNAKGTVPVAILSSETFDATTVNPETVVIAGTRVRRVGEREHLLCHGEFSNEDDRLDLVCHVVMADMVVAGDSVVVLEAETFDGTRIRGEDIVRIVPQ